MKNKEKKNWNMSALRLSCIPRTRDSWFFGDTKCRIWVYIAAHKNHCYITDNWNLLPASCINCGTINTFKKHLSSELESEAVKFKVCQL